MERGESCEVVPIWIPLSLGVSSLGADVQAMSNRILAKDRASHKVGQAQYMGGRFETFYYVYQSNNAMSFMFRAGSLSSGMLKITRGSFGTQRW
jgi:hypothetical protein